MNNKENFENKIECYKSDGWDVIVKEKNIAVILNPYTFAMRKIEITSDGVVDYTCRGRCN